MWTRKCCARLGYVYNLPIINSDNHHYYCNQVTKEERWPCIDPITTNNEYTNTVVVKFTVDVFTRRVTKGRHVYSPPRRTKDPRHDCSCCRPSPKSVSKTDASRVESGTILSYGKFGRERRWVTGFFIIIISFIYFFRIMVHGSAPSNINPWCT